jgi:glutathionylspermidine synthase
VVSTPFAALLESKAAQSLIWSMDECGVGFSEAQSQEVRSYMIPTSFDASRFSNTFVAKPVNGRGGSSIAIVKGRNVLEVGKTRHNDDDVFVYQEYIEP